MHRHLDTAGQTAKRDKTRRPPTFALPPRFDPGEDGFYDEVHNGYHLRDPADYGVRGDGHYQGYAGGMGQHPGEPMFDDSAARRRRG